MRAYPWKHSDCQICQAGQILLLHSVLEHGMIAFFDCQFVSANRGQAAIPHGFWLNSNGGVDGLTPYNLDPRNQSESSNRPGLTRSA